jgi:hypothetical protein
LVIVFTESGTRKAILNALKKVGNVKVLMLNGDVGSGSLGIKGKGRSIGIFLQIKAIITLYV